jgi:hypothetical protein
LLPSVLVNSAKSCFFQGDGFLSPLVYDQILTLEQHVQALVAPTMGVVATNLANGDPALLPALLEEACAVIRPGFQYMLSKFIGPAAPLAQAMQFFKAARALDPRRVRDLPTALADVMNYRFLTATDKLGLQKEWAAYLALALELPAAAAAAVDFDLLEWWRSKQALLPNFSRLAFIVAVVSPSSATVERVFSLLRTLIHDHQDSALEDFVEQGSLTVRYNNLSRRKLPLEVLARLGLGIFGL